jgi:hypothetical protein
VPVDSRCGNKTSRVCEPSSREAKPSRLCNINSAWQVIAAPDSDDGRMEYPAGPIRWLAPVGHLNRIIPVGAGGGESAAPTAAQTQCIQYRQ